VYKEKENPLRDKSYSFALLMLKRCVLLQKESKEYVISKQLMRSATSIGANIEEAIGGQSNKDFLHKISISYKEARETHYWLRLLGDAALLNEDETNEYLEKVEELLRIMTSIQKTMKSKL
jgi:four helix bundle protein